VQLTIDGIDPDDVDTDLLARGIARLASVVERPDEVRVIVAADFEQAVRDRVSDPEYAAAYTAERLFGRAAAKTISQDDGSTDLVIDAWLLSKNNAPQGHDIERLFHHEALHIAVHQRGEQSNDLRLRANHALNSNRGYFGAVAGVMIEEYRTERALCEAGTWPHDSYLSGFDEAVEAFREACWDGVCLRYPGEPIDRCCSTVLNAFHHLATYTGYVAAEMLASNRTRTPSLNRGNADRLLGPPWDAVVDALAAIPPATTPVARDQADKIAWEMADDVERWLDHVGFTLRDLPDGGAYFESCATTSSRRSTPRPRDESSRRRRPSALTADAVDAARDR
jgi:hypothetical protein